MQYLREFLRMRKRYPGVKTWSAWNEANQCGTGTCDRADIVARYYNTIRRNCPGCKVLAADLLDQPNMVGWARAFRRAARFEPKYWGLHDYIDANRFQTTRTAQLLRAVRGEVWLTEIGGLVARRNGSKIKLPQGKAHAARATRFIFDRLARLDRRVGADLHLPLAIDDEPRQLGLRADRRQRPAAAGAGGAQAGARRPAVRALTRCPPARGRYPARKGVRAKCCGCTKAFQAFRAGSIPVARFTATGSGAVW